MDKIIQVVKYIIIGLVQGVSEILPISSSGHLVLTYNMLKIDSSIQLDLTIFLHFASCIALCFYFKDNLKNLIKNFFSYVFKKESSSKKDFLTVIYLICGSIPVAIVGFFIKPFVEQIFSNPIFTSIGFFISSILVFTYYKIKQYNQNYNFKNTMLVGLMQCFSVFPGISRSGTTLCAGKLSKLEEKQSKEYVFLLLLPICFGGTLLSFIDIKERNYLLDNIPLYLISFFVSLVFTYISLKFIFNKINNKTYKYFAIYLIILSVFTFILYI